MRSVVLSLLALTLAACDTAGPVVDRDDVNLYELNHDAGALVGNWELVRTTNSGQMGPPQTVAVGKGERTSYAFAADGTVDIVRPGRATESTTWVVEPPSHLRIGSLGMSFGIDGDRLYLDRRPMDGSLLEFARR
ncbi:hypothetical protein [Rubrivirga marina]|uniref:Lipocalin-like domain-containing protein n=1 Tax=Rubrivirga marina TaxID=1196024 RepID=A0A271IWP7_9BACT|nr:hypothetical protein [Rubrivirga marina]PAP75550.1 hypothetical protein BSZ37_03390 [Rubrivirga marina]